MKTLVIRPLTLLTIFLSLIVGVFASEQNVISDDNIILLKKRVEVAEMKAKENDAALNAAAKNLGENARVHIALAKTKINLYRKTGERNLLLKALEEQLNAAKKLHQYMKANYDATAKGISKSDIKEAELAEFEAELELKNEKQKKTEQAKKFLETEIYILKKQVEINEKIIKRDDIMLAHGATGATINQNAIRHISLAKAKIALYKKTGEHNLLIKALEEQLKQTKRLNESMKLLLKGNAIDETKVTESELLELEAELELEKAKQEKR
jgi:hypothetical protein